MKRLKKRILSILTSCVMFCCSVSTFSAGADDNSITVNYYKYDLQLEDDEVRFSEYSLTLNPQNAAANSPRGGVTFPDTRVPDTNSSVVRVRMWVSRPYGSSSFVTATGFIVDAHTIATAAHVVYTTNAAGVEYGVEFGYVLVDDEETGNTIQHAITEVHIPKAYTQNDSHENDYALVTVDADLTEYGFFELGCIDGTLTEADDIMLSASGFPVNVYDENNEIIDDDDGQLYTGRGNLLYTSDECIYYDNDVNGGNSGGPIYVTTRYTTNGTTWNEYNTAVGICTGADAIPGTQNDVNDAKRITPTMLQFYFNNPEIGY